MCDKIEGCPHPNYNTDNGIGACIFHTQNGKKKLIEEPENQNDRFISFLFRNIRLKVEGEDDPEVKKKFIADFNNLLDKLKTEQSGQKILDISNFIFPDFNEDEWRGLWKSLITTDDYIDFAGHNLSLKAYNTTFLGIAYFRSANFGGKADFGAANFGGVANFRSANFGGEARFGYANFGGEANFWSTNFGGEANFWSTNFGGEANFLSANFDGEANFRYANFGGKADFGAANFDGEANFRSANFGDEAYFGHANFGDKASFRYANFDGEANFESANFGGEASFRYARFGGEAGFVFTTFSNITIFAATKVIKEFILHNCYFPENSQLDFDCCEVSGPLRIRDLLDVSEKEKDEKRRKENREKQEEKKENAKNLTLVLTDLRFYSDGHLIIEDVDLSKASFWLSSFVYVRPRVDFIRVKWGEVNGHKVIADDYIKVREKSLFPKDMPEKDKAIELERLYLQLRLAYETRGDYAEAGDFFIGEMRARQKRLWLEKKRIFCCLHWL